ncbi:NUDIX hydrolase [Yoonia maritima]|uniref:NUDIX hydrolase n=1 Tax=Yoonia maritima TaxID=1435347 RepID=UPI000D103E21|nr:NUDIX hydrolase [Yoonia maritima]
MRTTGQHDGAKVALFLGDKLISILRDDFDHIPYPNLWDLPGGGREGDETPFETVTRELNEELGLSLPPAAVLWQSNFAANYKPDAWVGFFVAQLPADTVTQVKFGDEGQRWDLFDLLSFIALPNRVPSFGARLALWEKETGGLPD